MGGGCFWCVEAVIQRLRGVVSVTSGYTGGETENPSYKEICTGTTGHAEVVQVEFDEELIDYRQLLTVFMLTHDPTTLNRQGNDVGTQYRSAIYYHDEQQQTIAKEVIEDIGVNVFIDANSLELCVNNTTSVFGRIFLEYSSALEPAKQI